MNKYSFSKQIDIMSLCLQNTEILCILKYMYSSHFFVELLCVFWKLVLVSWYASQIPVDRISESIQIIYKSLICVSQDYFSLARSYQKLTRL